MFALHRFSGLMVQAHHWLLSVNITTRPFIAPVIRVGIKFYFELESADKLTMNLNLNVDFQKSMTLDLNLNEDF